MTTHRNVYLKMKTLIETREILKKEFHGSNHRYKEKVNVPDAVGRILAEPVTAKISSPNYNAAAMDGIAVRSEQTFGASEKNPKELTIGENAFYINTGQVLPEATNSVIMIENVNVINKEEVQIEAPAFPWQNIRKIGEDIVATELLFPQNHLITPYCIGALLSGGVFTVPVKKKPRILIIPTGSELLSWEKNSTDQLKQGQIFETNSFVLGKLTEACGGEFVRHEMLKDNIDRIKQAILNASKKDFDIILTIGGSSAGSKDFAKKAIKELGNILVHGVTIMPGKPVIIGKINSKPIFGIPGYPVSAIIAFEQFVQPLILRMLGQPEIIREKTIVEPTRKIASKLGVEEFLRVKLGAVGNRIVATPLKRAAGCITSITEADGIIRLPNHIDGLKDNETVYAELLRPLSLVKNTIVIVGSHDNTLDVLADQLKSTHSDLTFSSSHVGSVGGLMAIKRKVCHLAGSHLLDTKDGTYNISYIRKYLPDIKVKVVNLVFRDQGLIVQKNNPKKIKGIEDLGRNDISMINRQLGSGTRILLDYRLKKLGMDPALLEGYENDEYTHMAVAAAVLSGSVDVGLGIFAAAKALNLDFIPIITEQYDLIIPEEHFESKNIKILLNMINSKKFKNSVEALGGYGTKITGKIIM